MPTKIEWVTNPDGSLGETWNPIRGCARVSEGCRNCYAERFAARFSGPGQPYEGLAEMTPLGPRWTGTIELVPKLLDQPLRWKKPKTIFVNSMSDLFHEDVLDDFLLEIFVTMVRSRQHIFQILTKRPERMRLWLSRLWVDKASIAQNIWLGVSCEDQKTANERIPLLIETPASVRFVSCEPLLERVDLRGWFYFVSKPKATPHKTGGIDWLIVGGESGPNHRPMKIEWLESIVGQCREAGVPIFVKQDSAPWPGRQGSIPDELWIKEFPKSSLPNQRQHEQKEGKGE